MAAIAIKPVTSAEWDDLESLFLTAKIAAICWCMYWRRKRSDWARGGNKVALEELVNSDSIPGLLAYDGDTPIGWCAIAPRTEHPTLNRSRTLKRIDDEPVWSITCFVIAEEYRGRGLTEVLAREAVQHAAANGATIVEAYPLINKECKRQNDADAYTGFASTFKRLGFREAAHRSEVRNVMRLRLTD